MTESEQTTPAALYARVSSDRQDVDLSVAGQLRALRDYAERNGYLIMREYVDEAESGRVADRPQFRKMLEEASQSDAPFQEILVWKFSRFTRKREHAVAFKSMLRRRGIRVTSITEHADDTPTGKLMEAIIESVDEFYSENLAQEVTRGMREAASRGFFLSSKAPFGYRRIKVQDGAKERPTLEVNSDTGPIVKEIFEKSLRGVGLKEIAADLNQRGITNKGKRWQRTSLHYVLTNEAYTGMAVWGKTTTGDKEPEPVRAEGAWEALVSREMFDAVQKGLEERAPKKRQPARVGSKFLLSGLLRCGVCSKPYTGQGAKSGRFSYYVCGTLLREGSGSCTARYLNADRVESCIVDAIRGRILNDETITELVVLIAEEIDSLAGELGGQLHAVEAEMADVRSRLDRLYEALETTDLTMHALSPRILKLRQREDQLAAAQENAARQLKQRRADLPTTAEIGVYVADFREFLAEGSIPERKALIRNFVESIEVDDRDAILTYTIPMPSDGVTRERMPVLDFVQSGPPSRTELRTPSASATSAASLRPIGLSSGIGIV
ncbi:MAG: recombinase family protein [Chloroflexi bacterium]|nr:recombinase family protein [Chloroflexota bacterium]